MKKVMLLLSLFILCLNEAAFAQSIDWRTLPSKAESEEVQRIMALPLFKATSKYINSLLELGIYKKARFKESELAFAWSEKVFSVNHCHKMSEILGPGHSESCLNGQTQKVSAFNDGRLPLDPVELKKQVLQHFGARIQEIEKELPGFSEWIFRGFQSSWSLQEDEITESICQNQTLYKIKKETVACYTGDLVRLSKRWYESTLSESSKVAEMIIHELIRIRVTTMAPYNQADRQRQDNLVASLTMSVLNSKVPAQKIYKDLQDGQLILFGVTAEELRLTQLSILADRRAGLAIKSFNFVPFRCNSPNFETKIFKKLMTEMVQSIAECRRYIQPNDMAILCETDLISLRLTEFARHCPNIQEALPDIP